MTGARRILAACLAAWAAGAVAAPRGPVMAIPDAASIEHSCTETIERGRKDMAAIASGRARDVLREWNRAEIRIDDVINPMDILAGNHPDKAVRSAAETCQQRLTAFWTDIYQDEKLYKRLSAVKPANPRQAKLRKDLLESFEDTGVTLPPDRRARAKEILEALESLRQAFERNSRDDPARVTFTAAEMEGLPEAYLKARKPDAAGNYVLGLDQPTYGPFMANARSEAARERYYRARTRKGGDANLEILHQMFVLRKELANLYDLPTFADYALRRRMGEKPTNVSRFLAEVKSSLDALDRQAVEELRRAKAADRGTPLAETKLNIWDQSYYQDAERRARFSVDQEKLRAYFPADKSVAYALLLSSRLYRLRFVEEKPAVWHPDVRYFDVFDEPSGKYRGGIYIDLFPREGKRAGAAAYPIRSASRIEGRTPTAALEANFERAGFNQRELAILLHEFGHVLNMVLSDVDYARHALNSIKWDFVEAPSQMFEEWARRPQTLALFAEVCPECPRLTAAEIAKLDEARRYGLASVYARQWLLAAFDMEMSTNPRPPLDVWKRMESETALGHVEGTMFPADFRHIAANYASGYYGYMWSQVIARDMLSQFGDDLLDTKAAARYREAILSQGSQQEESAMVRHFLGREPSSRAFFSEITGTP